MMAALFVLSMSGSTTHVGPSQPLSQRIAPKTVKATPKRFPILTPQLGIARANPTKLNLRFPLGRPLCIVGYDAISITWLQKVGKRLAEGGAVCYVVNVLSETQFNSLKTIVPNLPMAAVPGKTFAEIGLRGYPALITQSGRVQ
jgi:integrating conjugative element protein (TIGR03765 family)